jgi:DNA-binding GntR family transcriptional regulator
MTVTTLPREPRIPRPTLAEQLAADLAEQIVAGRRPPGATLEEVHLAAEFSVSRTPVREALCQLGATGLVEHRPRRGAVVARPDAERLHGMFRVMAELEALAATVWAGGMTARDRRALDQMHTVMAEMVRGSRLAEYRAANVEFHRRLYAGAGNEYLAELAGATRQRLAPFRASQLKRRSACKDPTPSTARSRRRLRVQMASAPRIPARRHLNSTEAAWISTFLQLMRPIPGRRLAGPALRRDETTRGPRPYARQRRRAGADGRALRRVGRHDARTPAGRAAGHLATHRTDRAVRHPLD